RRSRTATRKSESASKGSSTGPSCNRGVEAGTDRAGGGGDAKAFRRPPGRGGGEARQDPRQTGARRRIGEGAGQARAADRAGAGASLRGVAEHLSRRGFRRPALKLLTGGWASCHDAAVVVDNDQSYRSPDLFGGTFTRGRERNDHALYIHA